MEIVGNAKGLLQLRRQIDLVLKGEEVPLDDAIYRDEYEEHQVVVRRARSREEMRPPMPERKEAPERVPWAERARRSAERRGEE